MPYKPYPVDWWRLPRVVRHLQELGADQAQAQQDICGALKDGKIYIQGEVAQSDRYAPGKGVSSTKDDVRIPKNLKPADLDWKKSRPRNAWWTGNGRLGFDYEKRKIGYIELRREDVLETFGEPSGLSDNTIGALDPVAAPDAAEYCPVPSDSDRGEFASGASQPAERKGAANTAQEAKAGPQSGGGSTRTRGRSKGDNEQRIKEIKIVLAEAEREYPSSNRQHPSFSAMAKHLVTLNGIKDTRFNLSAVQQILRGVYPAMIAADIKSPYKK
jgi:hypothetical protein